MFEKNMRIAYLIDFYEDLLDPHVRNVMRAYYDDDLSLAEIAEHTGTTRQGVRERIVRAEEGLRVFEAALGLLERERREEEGRKTLLKIADRIGNSFPEESDEIRRLVRQKGE